MACPLYCILSAGTVHCIPVATFTTVQETPAKLTRFPAISAENSAPVGKSARTAQKSPKSSSKAAELPSLIKTRNLLYTLNNPSLSDLESEPSRRFSETSCNHDDELTQDDERPKSRASGLKNGFCHPGTDSESEGKALFPSLAVEKRFEASADSDSERAPQDMPIGAGTLGEAENTGLLAILNDYLTHAVYLPQYSVDLQDNLDSDFTQIRGLLPKIFPEWQGAISIRQLTGGITNMLLLCLHTATDETLLMRVYGKGTNLIIDRNREFVSHLTLNLLKLAPAIHCRFANGLIYGFLPGRSLEPHELSHPYLYPLIAQQLGHWHNKINCEFIEDGIDRLRKHTSKKRTLAKKSINNLWDLMEDWVSILPITEALVQNFKENLGEKDGDIRDVVLEELRWVRQALKRATRSEMVVCHCDLLSGNIIIPETEEFQAEMNNEPKLPKVEENPIQFIDYEYMIPAPRAFDIANHFAEWQGFDCNRGAIPKPEFSNPVMVNWCKGYLNDKNASDEQIKTLIDEIACYSGLPGFYWGIWAMIQSELSIIDFNYAEYSLLRLEEYWIWKRQFLKRA